MAKESIYLIHGYAANPEKHWFPWLGEKVKSELDLSITSLTMPDSLNPKKSEWDKTCERNITSTESLTLIGHSLGCITALRFLDQHDINNVNLLLVSGFDEPVYPLPQLDEFTQQPLNYQKLRAKINQATVISAQDDDIVPYPYAETLARHLQSKFVLLPHGKHFIDRDHITQLPVAYQELKNLLLSR